MGIADAFVLRVWEKLPKKDFVFANRLRADVLGPGVFDKLVPPILDRDLCLRNSS